MVRKRKRVDIFNIVNGTIMVLLMFAFIIPFWIIFTTSFSDNQRVQMEGLSIWFRGFSFEGYKFLFGMSDLFLRSLGVSLFTSAMGSFLSVFVCSLAAYTLSKKYFVGRKVINIFLMITMFFGGGTIPTYLVVRAVGLYDTVWALIIPGIANTYNILLVRNYLYSLPRSLEEAAELDGANDAQLFFRIFMPLTVPMMFTIGVMTFIGKWNEWLPSLLYLGATNKKAWTAQYVLRQMLRDMQALYGSTSTGSITSAPLITAKNAAIVVVVLPLVIASPILHKYFTKGITAGAVKG